MINMNKLNQIEKWMLKKFESPVGDFRDWDAVTVWATSIADIMKEAVS